MMRDSGVSPVVGVMALLTLGIIFAAILSAFAGGFVDKPSVPPSAELTAYSAGQGDSFCIMFEHRGGDQLSPSDCNVQMFMKTAEGSFSIADISDEVWRAGRSVSTGNLSKTADLFGITETELEEAIERTVPVELRIYHQPTNVILYQSKILLEEHV